MKATLWYAGAAAAVTLATTGRPFWWTAIGLAAAALAVAAASPQDVRTRFAPVVIGLGVIAVVSGAYAVARGQLF